jgi:hypothetical protein
MLLDGCRRYAPPTDRLDSRGGEPAKRLRVQQQFKAGRVDGLGSDPPPEVKSTLAGRPTVGPEQVRDELDTGTNPVKDHVVAEVADHENVGRTGRSGEVRETRVLVVGPSERGEVIRQSKT